MLNRLWAYPWCTYGPQSFEGSGSENLHPFSTAPVVHTTDVWSHQEELTCWLWCFHELVMRDCYFCQGRDIFVLFCSWLTSCLCFFFSGETLISHNLMSQKSDHGSMGTEKVEQTSRRLSLEYRPHWHVDCLKDPAGHGTPDRGHGFWPFIPSYHQFDFFVRPLAAIREMTDVCLWLKLTLPSERERKNISVCFKRSSNLNTQDCKNSWVIW